MTGLESLFSLAGKTALVTGGSRGVGRMIAEALVMAGAEVMIVARNGAACEETAREINALGHDGRCEGFAGDVGDAAAVDALVAAVGGRTDRLGILVNNAGTSWGAPFGRFPHAQWERVMSVNVAGMFTLTQGLYDRIRAAAVPGDPARIINIGSVMGTVPVTEGAYSYTMSKAAVHHMTRVFAAEFAADHVTCNALAPGPFASKMTAFATGTEAGAAKVARNVPLGRIGAPQDVGGAAIYLCARAGAYVTGAILPVDGGMSAQTPVELFANTL